VWGLWQDGAVWFSTSPESQKARNLARDPRVAVHLESGDETVILDGAVEFVTDRAALEPFAAAYERKYGIRLDLADPDFGVYVLRPRVAQTWREADFPRTVTRWAFD
jgi:general stress protein 26